MHVPFLAKKKEAFETTDLNKDSHDTSSLYKGVTQTPTHKQTHLGLTQGKHKQRNPKEQGKAGTWDTNRQTYR